MAADKLVLCVIDAMAPGMLEQAVASGEAPVLAGLIERGLYVPDCVAAFPSVTPVCAASIVTGARQDRHAIPAMNWYHRSERRYIEYGSSFRASQRVGIARQLMDTVYNMNGAHLSRELSTIFETLDDAQLRTAGTTYVMYRGRHRHEPQRDTALTLLASTLMRYPVMGPRELFYADVFASRRTGCRSGLGMPGVRDRHSGCVGAHLVEHDLFDFLLLSLPDNDWYSHKYGPEAQVRSIALADSQLARVIDAGGGMDEFLDEYAVIVLSDHAQTPVRHAIALQDELEGLGVLAPGDPDGEDAHIAVCPSQRAAMVYVLAGDRLRAWQARVIKRALAIDGVELVMWLERDAHGAPLEGVIARSQTGELRFAPGSEVQDERGGSWSLEGELAVLGGSVRDRRLRTPAYPDGLGRVWSALCCASSGEVLLSAARFHEFLDWGGQAHVGGGSHGSLQRGDSLCALVMCGVQAQRMPVRWTLGDVAPLVVEHFGISPPGSSAG